MARCFFAAARLSLLFVRLGSWCWRMSRSSVFARQPLDQPQVQIAFCSPAVHTLRNSWPKAFVKTKCPLSQFLWLETVGEPLHGRTNSSQVLATLAFQVAPHTLWLDGLGTTYRPDSILGILGGHRPTTKLDPELLASLLLRAFL